MFSICFRSRKIKTLPKPHTYGHCYYDEEEADWFDFGDEIQILEGNSQIGELSCELFPVPEEPVVPIEQLTVALMDDYEFYCDDQDFIQVYTDGSYINGRYKLIDSVSAIGVWFGPNHKLWVMFIFFITFILLGSKKSNEPLLHFLTEISASPRGLVVSTVTGQS